jgi:SAM-dependent methyltransferase
MLGFQRSNAMTEHREQIEHNDTLRGHIRDNYAQVARGVAQGGCCAGGCSCSSGAQEAQEVRKIALDIGYQQEDLTEVPIEANLGLGCGNPLALAALKPGETVLDLGSGGGFDCFLARKRVGSTGKVIGVDMTPEMLQLARSNAAATGYTNVEFRLGEIEHLPVADSSVDVIISNCVVNLSLDKQQVFHEAFRVLRSEGRLSISDIVATAPLPTEIKQDLRMLAGCVAGAEHVDTVRQMLETAGFQDIKLFPKDTSRQILNSWAPGRNLEDFVASFTIEAKKT